MSTSQTENKERLLRDVQGYEPERQSFYLGLLAVAYNVSFEEVLQVENMMATEVKTGFDYGQFERAKVQELEKMAANNVDEVKMLVFIVDACEELITRNLNQGQKSEVNFFDLFKEFIVDRFIELRNDRLRGFRADSITDSDSTQS